VGTVNRRPSSGFVHDAFFYSADDELVRGAVPFLRDGIAAGDTAMIVCGTRHAALLARAVDDPRLRVVAPGEIYQRPTGALDAYRNYLDQVSAEGRGLRVVAGECAPSRPVRWREWERYEAVCNWALAPYPLWSMCLYHERELSAEVLSGGARTHPYCYRGGERRRNDEYQDPATLLRDSAVTGPDPIERYGRHIDLGTVSDPATARNVLAAEMAGSDLAVGIRFGFAVAVSEVVTNALTHGREPVTVQAWVTPSRVLCTVTDQGLGFADPFTGYLRPAGRTEPVRGLGLWLARQHCDEVDAAMTPEGWTVRLGVSS